MKKTGYRPDVDGLRAIAVISVLLFHLDFAWASGGYVGVDVFFVISGFLITRLIVSELEVTDRFDFANFYVRRIRRIFPALFVTVAATFAASAWLLSPDHLEPMGSSVIAALSSFSNLLFWHEAGYFDVLQEFKPLLHTWSLSVEEQFYFVWPLLIMLAMRYWRPWIVLAVVATVSFAANFFFDQTTIFYWMPFRAFEFAIGGLLVKSSNVSIPNFFKEIGLLAGLAAIFASVTIFTTKTVFPSYNALLPCLGAALVIQCGQARCTRWLLSNPAMVGIGLVSYSLYLVHWPLIVLYRYWKFAPLTLNDRIFLSAVACILAIAMFFVIERPLRRTKWPFTLSAASAACLALAVSIPAFSAAQSGWPSRIDSFYPPEIRSVEQDAYANQMHTCRIDNAESIVGNCREDRGHTILIVGDSHAPAWYYAFSQVMPDTRFVMLSYLGCDTSLSVRNGVVLAKDAGEEYGKCDQKAKFLNDHKKFLGTLDAVILASYRPFSYSANPFRFDLIKYITEQRLGIKPIIIGDYFQTDPDKPCTSIMTHRNSVSACLDPQFVTYVGTREQIEKEPLFPYYGDRFSFIDVATLLCPGLKSCPASADGVPALYDSDHSTFTFARFVLKSIMVSHPEVFSTLGLSSATPTVASQ